MVAEFGAGRQRVGVVAFDAEGDMQLCISRPFKGGRAIHGTWAGRLGQWRGL
jgi:hypothetical protein